MVGPLIHGHAQCAVRAATEPFAALAEAVGGDPEAGGEPEVLAELRQVKIAHLAAQPVGDVHRSAFVGTRDKDGKAVALSQRDPVVASQADAHYRCDMLAHLFMGVVAPARRAAGKLVDPPLQHRVRSAAPRVAVNGEVDGGPEVLGLHEIVDQIATRIETPVGAPMAEPSAHHCEEPAERRRYFQRQLKSGCHAPLILVRPLCR